MKIYKVQTPLWWRTHLLNHVRCEKKKKNITFGYETAFNKYFVLYPLERIIVII